MRVAILCFLTASWMLAQEPGQRMDKLFEKFSGKTPGCAVGVAQDGKVTVAKGYGLADLEHDVPLSPQSLFYMASVSKQFTAMSILLLAEDGKIQLSDSIRKTIPELPDYASAITINQLLTHTSGIRDYLTLGGLAGHPNDFVFTDRSALALVSRQRALNFEPGSEYLYSNSGYFLLSLVVKRVTQKNLNEFAQKRIFAPLKMKGTRFQHDHSTLVPEKALGYGQRDQAWHVSNSMLDVVGDGGLYSSVEDMLRWVENFDNPKIGANALAIMQTPGKLSSGTNINYGMGLVPSEFRGLRTVEHGGGLGGYRTEVLWFPVQRFSVVCLCNNGSANPAQLARRVAAIYLSSEIKAPRVRIQRNLTAVALTAEEIRAKSGFFREGEGSYIEITDRNGKLYLEGESDELIPLDKRRFTQNNTPEGWELEFDGHNPATSFEFRAPGKPGARYERVETVTLSQDQMKAYTGEFESRELQTTYRISLATEGFSLEVGDAPAVNLQSAGPERMWSAATGMELLFQRNGAGRVSGFYLNAGGVRKLDFQRI